jgi:transcriptional accessory protein Tex/SPT6
VRNLTSFGAFVEIEPGIDGLIHISDMSWTKRVQHPSEVVKKGDTVDVVILNIDSENKRISLGLKQAEEDPWLRIGETYPVGTELTGSVVRLMDKGVVVDIGNDIEGFVPLSQLNVSGKTVESPAEVVYETMRLEMRVLEVDPIHRSRRNEHPRGSAAASGGAAEDHPDGVGARHGISAGRYVSDRRWRVTPHNDRENASALVTFTRALLIWADRTRSIQIWPAHCSCAEGGSIASSTTSPSVKR